MVVAAITLFFTLAVTGFIAYFCMKRILPPFFIHGYGSTPIREVTLGLVIVLFGYVGLQVYRDYRDSKSSFNYWFAIGLFYAASGFAGAYMTNTIGNSLNWVSRFAIYAGNLCLLAAAIKGIRTTHAK